MNKSPENSYSPDRMSTQAHAATLKGKINQLEETIHSMIEELNFYKKEVSTLRSEKETLEGELGRRANDMKKQLTNEVIRADDELKKAYTGQKNENTKLQ